MDHKAAPKQTSDRTTARDSRRRAYRAPTVTDFGDVEKLTQGVSSYVPV